MNLLHFVPRTNVRGYILVPLRGSRMTVLFHRGLDFCVLTQTLPCWALLCRRSAADEVFVPAFAAFSEWCGKGKDVLQHFRAGFPVSPALRLMRFVLPSWHSAS